MYNAFFLQVLKKVTLAYLPAEAPLLRCETFLYQLGGRVSSSISGVLLGSAGCRLRCVDRGEDLGGGVLVTCCGCCCCCWMVSGKLLAAVVGLVIAAGVGELADSFVVLGGAVCRMN
jgi:hypothetical protein